MNRELLGKYLNNNCNKDELGKVLNWFRDSAGTSEGEAVLYSVWEEFPLKEPEKLPDFDSILDRIHHEVNIRQYQNDISGHHWRRNIKKFLRNAAAILLLPAIGTGLFYSYKYYSSGSIVLKQAYNEVFSSVDAIINVTLPDGSKVWLNHSSSLRYPALFSGKTRDVELIGEGYFEVFHNEKMHFIVKAGELDIVALGTTFNIMAYPDENKIETSLIDGHVEIRKAGNGNDSEAFHKMKTSEVAVYLKADEKIITKDINDERYFSWKNGKLIFSAEPMEEVIKKLSRWFNVDIQIKDPEMNDLTLTATFVHETLPQVMELLARIIPIQYSISPREDNGDGTFTKREVDITLRKGKMKLY